jgi:hypothetical protein
VNFPVATFEVSDRHASANNIFSRTVTTRAYVHDDAASYSATLSGYSSLTTHYTVGKNVAPRFLVGGSSLSFSNNGINWYDASTNIPLTTINDIEYNGTVYVAGGSNANHTFAYSDNGTDWYSGGNTTITSVCNAVRWGGYPQKFMAVGSGGNAIAYSVGGLHWTGLGTAMFGGTPVGQTIEWNGSFWLAGASNGSTYKLARSVDGSNGWVGIDISNTAANSIYQVMWNGGQWIIGGNTNAGTGLIAYSTDALSWTAVASCPITTRVTGIAYNGNRVVAVGNGAGNTMAYSDDFGITWTGLGVTLLPNTSPTSIHKVEWHINKFIVAGTNTSGRILYSLDGFNWKVASGSSLTSCRAIASSSRMQHPVQFTANSVISSNSVSRDGGHTWAPILADNNVHVAAFNGKMAIFGQGENGNTYVSYDLTTAFKITTANTDPSGVRALEWNGVHWLMGGVSHGATSRHLLLSYDGLNWKPVATTFMTSGYYVTGMDWSPTLSRWCVSVQTGATTNQMIYGDGLNWSLASTAVGGGPVRWTGTSFIAAVNDSASTKIAVSQDGIVWATRTLGSYGQVQSIVANDTTIILGTYPNSTSVEAILKSIDSGATWTAVGGINQNYSHTAAVYDGIRYLIKTDNPVNSIRSSYDGITWTSIGGNLPGLGLAWTKPNTGVMTIYQPTIVCGSGNSSTMAFSKDGLFFKSLGDSLFSNRCNYAGWNGRMWIACGKGAANTLGYSYDGLVWTGLGASVFSEQANHVIWNGARWVAAGEGGNTLATSVDGLVWTGLGTSAFDTSGQCVQWNGSVWLAGGAGSVNTLAYSADGVSWTGLGKPLDTATNDVQWIGTQWVIVGKSTTSNLIMFAADHLGTWTASSSQPFTTSANSVFWNGRITVAVGEGTNTIASSADLGASWTGLGTSVFSTRGNEVAWNDKRWVATGSGTNTIAYSNDGATWWPCIGNGILTEGLGIGSNPKVGATFIKSAISLNNREKVCVNSPIYYDTGVADDTSLVFNLNI